MATLRKTRAFVSGITGQDGSYLAEYLLSLGYEVYGFMRRTSHDSLERLHPLADGRKIHLLYGNLRDSASIQRALAEAKPDEIYNLAAMSDVGISFKCPEETMEINYLGVARLVYEAVKLNPKVRIYQASTSEMFGRTKPPQNEKSVMAPVSPYAEAKLLAHENVVKPYRDRGVYICSGFLFNHESPRRGEHFVTRKVTMSLAKIKLGLQDSFALGNLEAKRDWGFAGDYVKAMHLMLQQKKPQDFVIATGKSYSIRDLVNIACAELGMFITWKSKGLNEKAVWNGKTILTISKEFYRPAEVNFLKGDARKAKRVLKWEPKVSFTELICMMVNSDLELCKK